MMLVLVVAGCGFGTAKIPGKRALAAMELVRDGKLKQLADYFPKKYAPASSAFFYGVISLALLENVGETKIEVESEQVDGDSATVNVRWYYKSGGSDHVVIDMAKEDRK